MSKNHGVFDICRGAYLELREIKFKIGWFERAQCGTALAIIHHQFFVAAIHPNLHPTYHTHQRRQHSRPTSSFRQNSRPKVTPPCTSTNLKASGIYTPTSPTTQNVINNQRPLHQRRGSGSGSGLRLGRRLHENDLHRRTHLYHSLQQQKQKWETNRNLPPASPPSPTRRRNPRPRQIQSRVSSRRGSPSGSRFVNFSI